MSASTLDRLPPLVAREMGAPQAELEALGKAAAAEGERNRAGVELEQHPASDAIGSEVIDFDDARQRLANEAE